MFQICIERNVLVYNHQWVNVMKYKRIRDLREDKDMTQKTMSEYLHISQRTYSHIENGTRGISTDILVHIADCHNVSVDYLLERTNKKEINR